MMIERQDCQQRKAQALYDGWWAQHKRFASGAWDRTARKALADRVATEIVFQLPGLFRTDVIELEV